MLCPVCLLTSALAFDDGPCPYQVLAPIEERPGSTSYLAHEMSGRHEYVELELFSSRDDGDLVLQRFAQWKARLEGFSHPGVARLVGAGRTEAGQLYLATDYVPGYVLTAQGPHGGTRPSDRYGLALQVATAMAAVHAAGLAHLALTPARVKVSTVNGLRGTVVGIGRALVLDDVQPSPEPDLRAVASILDLLGFHLPGHPYPSMAGVVEALAAASAGRGEA